MIPYWIRKHYYRYKLFKRFKRHYVAPWEFVETLFHINFECLCEFYEKGGIDYICWDSDDEHRHAKSEMDYLYNWCTKELPEREEEIEVVLSTWSEHHVNWFEPYDVHLVSWKSASCKYGNFLFKLHNELEKKLYEAKQQNLISLIKIRDFLWI